MAVYRIYVEKKPGVDVEAQGVYHDLVSVLGITSLQAVRVLNCYDVEGMTDEDFRAALDIVFCEPPVDVKFNTLILFEGWQAFGVQALPGQYDQRADSAAQCVQILTQKERPEVRFTRVFALQGALTADELSRIKAFLINPVEAGEVSLRQPETLRLELPEPPMVETMTGFINKSKEEIAALRREMGLAQTVADLLFVQDYFQKKQRDPTITELRVIDTYWSDHCRHTTFLTKLENATFDYAPAAATWQQYLDTRKRIYAGKQKDICLMDIAVLGMKALKADGLIPDLDESEEINACSIVVQADIDGQEQEWLVMFKNETHNHPTEIEPFGGAATCLGGAIRDPLSGRSYVYQAMRVTGSGDPRTPYSDTLPGKLPQRSITRGAAAGYSAYGNQIGLATGLVHEVYHPGYVAKRMEIGAVVGAAPRAHVRREVPVPGDVVVLLGGRTGRDGIGGATGSSKEHTQDSLGSCGAEVQKGNPPTERKLQRLYRNTEFSQMVKRCNDFGAGGVCVAIGELADGLRIILDRVPRKYDGLDGTELAISESQERMAVVVAAADAGKITQLADEENLESTVVATITEQPVLAMEWRGQTIVEIERAFLDTNGATQTATAHVPAPKRRYFADKQFTRQGSWQDVLADLNVCSQKGLAERFDASIGAGSLLMPFGGAHQRTPTQVMAAALPVQGARTGTVMGWGYDPHLSSWSPYHGAVYAIVDALARVVAAGGDHRRIRLTLQEYFERLQDNPNRWGKPLAALLGAFSAQMALGLPAIGGKDSMSGTFMELDVPPTLVAFALAPIPTRRVISPEFKQPGRVMYWQLPRDAHDLPDYAALHNCYDAIAALPDGAVTAAWAIGLGGVLAAVSQMAFGNRLGFQFAEEWTDADLQEPAYGSLVLALADGVELPGTQLLGQITTAPDICINGRTLTLDSLQKAWEAPLEPIFPTTTGDTGTAPLPPVLPTIKYPAPRVRVARPRVLIPTFPGTNCEYDTARVFEQAGAVVEVLIVRNLTPQAIAETLERLVSGIRQAQILMLPGGFSGGDEPDGSAKFIATALRNPAVCDAIHHLLQQRDGLALGICNGFQALLKLGLLPYGEIRPLADDAPTLTFNAIGRHASCMVRTRIASNRSPWLAGVAVGEVHTVPISHGEGRFVAQNEQIAALMAAGQVATQYVDDHDQPTMTMPWNPNGSAAAIEGLLSPDGRVFGKMAHSERTGNGIARNVPGEWDQRIFASGVEYYL